MGAQFRKSREKGKSSQHDHISFLLYANAFEKMHCSDHFIFEHPSSASSWNEQCIQKPIARSSDSGVDGFFARSMSCIRPRGSVGAAWQTRKEAKTGGKNERALPQDERCHARCQQCGQDHAGGQTWICERTFIMVNESYQTEALEKWRESFSGVEPDRYLQVKMDWHKVVREDLRGKEELWDVAGS